ncbi:MAG: MFS transporter [Pseudomonadales bacterium]|nr:MFS transporter [Pseudomonadales bacterium]
MSSLIQTRGFPALAFMIFLNSFIDLGHKIVIQNIIFKLYDGSTQILLTAIVNALILLPYIFFFRPAGLASDNHAKSRILQIGSLAALFLTLAISLCYYFGLFKLAFALIFVLAIQSAFYAPAKYGLLKELVDNEHLTKANGVAQSLSTTGILAGILIFSIFFEARFPLAESNNADDILKVMFPLSWGLIFCSALETFAAFTLPKIKARPKPSNTNALQDLKTLKNNRVLWTAAIGTSIFWCAGQMLLATYPAFAKAELGITNTVVIQGMLAMNAIGVMIGAMIAGWFSRQFIEIHLLAIAGIGIILTVFFLPIIKVSAAAFIMFTALGISGGLLVVPLNALIQYCSCTDTLGKNLSNTVLIQTIAMLSCLIITMIAAILEIGTTSLLYFVAVFSCIGIVYVWKQLPHTLSRYGISPLIAPVFFGGKKIDIHGFNDVPGFGNVLYIMDKVDTRNKKLLQLTSARIISSNTSDDCAVITQTALSQKKNWQSYTHIYCDIQEAEKHIDIHFKLG